MESERHGRIESNNKSTAPTATINQTSDGAAATVRIDFRLEDGLQGSWPWIFKERCRASAVLKLKFMRGSMVRMEKDGFIRTAPEGIVQAKVWTNPQLPGEFPHTLE
jgi:hypothetical protein